MIELFELKPSTVLNIVAISQDKLRSNLFQDFIARNAQVVVPRPVKNDFFFI